MRWILFCILTYEVSGLFAALPWQALVVDDGGAYFRETVMTPAKTPVSFSYDGRERIGFVGCEVLARSLETKWAEGDSPRLANLKKSLGYL